MWTVGGTIATSARCPLKRAGASAKTRQVYKAIYSKARILVKVYGEIAGPVKVGRGALEGDITSPIYFNVGLESVFHLTDEFNSVVTRLDDIKIKNRTVDKFGFADDVRLLGGDIGRLSTTLQNIQVASESTGLSISVTKSFEQHIDRHTA